MFYKEKSHFVGIILIISRCRLPLVVGFVGGGKKISPIFA
jgi:hypothetical protein